MASLQPDRIVRNKALFWGFIYITLLPWLYFRVTQTVHPDLLWLFEAMNRIFHGSSMVDSAYEPNPPLSLILYFIPVLLKEYAGWPFHITGLAQSFVILTLGSLALHLALTIFSFIKEAHATLIMLGYIIANTICTNILFGERDHLIAMILPGFALVQLSLTNRIQKITPMIWLFLLFSSAIILLKPHYGVLPVALLLHRAYKNGIITTLRSPDFLSLAVMTTVYAAILWIFFQDYLTVILPDVVTYYLPMSPKDTNLWPIVSVFAAIGAALITLSSKCSEDTENKKFFTTLAGLGLLCLIPVIAQGKGFAYHYFACLTFYSCIGVPFLYNWLLKQSRSPAIAKTLTASSLLGLTYMICPLAPQYPSHTSYTQMALPTLIEKEARAHNSDSFFIFNSNMALSHEVSYYTGLKYASRFPSLWFLPGLYYLSDEMNEGRLTDEKAATLKTDIERYGSMFSEDLQNYKPGIVLVLTENSFNPPINPLKLFADQKKFRDAWGHYTHTGSVTLDEDQYYGGLVAGEKELKTFDIYTRKQ